MKLSRIAEKLALAAFETGAIKIQPDDPFTWASGRKSPIYNDNRLFLANHKHLKLIKKGFRKLISKHMVDVDVVAGTATAGIPHAAILAYGLGVPMVYIRDKQKDHGMKNRIEGIKNDENLNNQNVVVIEDLISTGGSSASAVQAVLEAQGYARHCFSIFSYGFPEVERMFKGDIPFKDNHYLSDSCMVDSILTYDVLLRVGIEHGHIQKDQEEFLLSWSADPKKWSDDWIASHS